MKRDSLEQTTARCVTLCECARSSFAMCHIWRFAVMAALQSWAFVALSEDWQSVRSSARLPLKPECCPASVQQLFAAAARKHPDLVSKFRPGQVLESENCSGKGLRLYGLVQISAGAGYQDMLTAGWSSKAFFLHEVCHHGARDAYVLNVHRQFCIPVWEDGVFAHRIAFGRPWSKRSKEVRWTETEVTAQSKSHKDALALKVLSWSDGSQGLQAGQGQSWNQVLQKNIFDASKSSTEYCTIGDVLQHVGGEQDLQNIPVIRLPSMIAFLVFAGCWEQVLMLSRWTHPCFPQLCRSLAPVWLREVREIGAAAAADELGSELLTFAECDSLLVLLRRLGLQVLAGMVDEDTKLGLRLELDSHLRRVRSHARSMDVSHINYVGSQVRGAIPSEAFVQQVLASLDLRDRNMLQRHAQRFISCLPEVMRPLLEAWVSKKVISGSSLTRGRLYLDLALQITHRERLGNSQDFLKFAWGDSTSKFGLEIYNARYRWLPKGKCVELARSWRYLCNHPWNEEMDEAQQAERAVHAQQLFDSVFLHTQVPQLIGNRRASLSDKAAAHVHSSLLEVSSLEELENSFANHVSWCSDMGVEAGLPAFCSRGPESTLPAWLRPVRVQVVTAEDDFFEDGAVLPVADATALMPSAFVVPGICHAIHNATATLETAFKGFERFNEQFGTLYKFLGSKQRRERFVEVVMKGTPQYPTAQKLFAKEVPSFYTKRWNALTECLQQTLPLAAFLRRHWDPVRYSEGLPHDPSVEDGWAPSQVGPILQDAFFFGFWSLQVFLRQQLREFMSWAEGCSCHVVSRTVGEEAESGARMSLERLLRSEIECPRHLPCRCPMMGCQAPFLASHHLSKLEEKLEAAGHDFVAECSECLSQEQWGDLLAEWQHGCNVIRENLKIRLNFYNSLPWVLLSGAHPDVSVAREGLKKAQKLWGELPANARSEQHALTRSLFLDPRLSSALEAFLASEAGLLEDFPVLEEFLAPFSFVQVAERTIEAAHKDLSQQQPKHFSMNLLSINMRLPELDRYLAGDASRFGSLVAAFHKVRRLRLFAESFPCHRNHPKLLTLRKCKKGSRFEGFVKEAFYRDVSMQFADNKEAAAVHTQEVKKKRRRTSLSSLKGQFLSLQWWHALQLTAFVKLLQRSQVWLCLCAQEAMRRGSSLRQLCCVPPSSISQSTPQAR